MAKSANSAKLIAIVVVLLCAACNPKNAGSQSMGSVSAPTAEGPVRNIPDNFPDFVKDALENAPDDVLVGIGVARSHMLNIAMTTSATRARVEISRQINIIVLDMVHNYVPGGADPSATLSFQENITVTISQSMLVGSRIVRQDRAEDGSVWTVIFMDKANVIDEIGSAQEAARLAVPAMASFDARALIDTAFANATWQDFQANDR